MKSKKSRNVKQTFLGVIAICSVMWLMFLQVCYRRHFIVIENNGIQSLMASNILTDYNPIKGTGIDINRHEKVTMSNDGTKYMNQSQHTARTLEYLDYTQRVSDTTGNIYTSLPDIIANNSAESWQDIMTTIYSYKDYTCPTSIKSFDVSRIHICGDTRDLPYKLIFLTTLYHNNSSMGFFYNTLRIIASMKHLQSIRPVVFLENVSSFLENQRTDFIRTACELGWTVFLAPQCNKYGFPVFKSMFKITKAAWSNTDWHCYSNGDMLYDESLVKTVDFVRSIGSYVDISLLMGRRYNLAVSFEN